jgi:hypothetical protein
LSFILVLKPFVVLNSTINVIQDQEWKCDCFYMRVGSFGGACECSDVVREFQCTVITSQTAVSGRKSCRLEITTT